MNHRDLLTETATRLTAAYQGEQRQRAKLRLVGALRAIPPDQRASEAESAICRLAKQEELEAKIKSLSDDDINALDIG